MHRETISFAGTSKLDGNRLSGIVHTYGTVTQRDGQAISFAPGAFTKALSSANADVVALWNHNSDMPLGRMSSGTLTLSDSEEGLHFSLDLPDVSYAEDLKVLVDRGDVNGMSFAMQGGKSQMKKLPNGLMTKQYTEVGDLVDISPVSLPAFTGTSLNRFAQSYENESIKSQLIRARQRVRMETNDN